MLIYQIDPPRVKLSPYSKGYIFDATAQTCNVWCLTPSANAYPTRLRQTRDIAPFEGNHK